MSTYLPEKTIKYKTYIKEAMVESLRKVFTHHTDTLISRTKVNIDFPRKEADYPAVIVRFFERDINNFGIGHEEWIQGDGAEDDVSSNWYRFKHYNYHGDIELAVYGLSSLDRDLVADTLVQIVAMGDLEAYTNAFFERIYPDETTGEFPDSIWHYININSDKIQGFGEGQAATPWGSEDDLIYTTSYRSPVFGEFYSVPPDAPAGFIAKITQYPYIGGVEEVPTGDPADNAVWVPPVSQQD